MARMKYHEIASSRNLELHCFKRNKKKYLSLSLCWVKLSSKGIYWKSRMCKGRKNIFGVYFQGLNNLKYIVAVDIL